jgi:hypothetical protein
MLMVNELRLTGGKLARKRELSKKTLTSFAGSCSFFPRHRAAKRLKDHQPQTEAKDGVDGIFVVFLDS